MTKKQAIAIITKCAKQYQQYLEGYQVVFVYRDENNRSDHTAVRFHSHNFLHFTGVSPRQGMNANGFYRAALNNRLSEHDFSFKNNHTTELKLKVLDIIMNIDTKARMIGNYIGTSSGTLYRKGNWNYHRLSWTHPKQRLLYSKQCIK